MHWKLFRSKKSTFSLLRRLSVSLQNKQVSTAVAQLNSAPLIVPIVPTLAQLDTPPLTVPIVPTLAQLDTPPLIVPIVPDVAQLNSPPQIRKGQVKGFQCACGFYMSKRNTPIRDTGVLYSLDP